MLFRPRFGRSASLSLLLIAAACSNGANGDLAGSPPDVKDDTSPTKPNPPSTEPGKQDPGKQDPGKQDPGKQDPGTTTITSKLLAEGDLVLFGLAGDDAIYVELGWEGNSLHVVPIVGGSSSKIADLGDDDQLVIDGGAVAFWTDMNGERGTLNVWTRATGLLTNVASNSMAGTLFRASADGSRIAFSQDATLTAQGKPASTAIGVRDVTASTNAATLSGQTALNLASGNCSPQIGFSEKVFFASFCTGTSANAADAKLVAVSAGATAEITRLDAASVDAAGTLKPVFAADASGTKVFTITNGNAGMLISVADPASRVTFDEGAVAEGHFLPDGSSVIYRTIEGALKKATFASPQTASTMVAADVKGVLSVSADNKQILFHKQDFDPETYLSDVHVVDHTASTFAPFALVPTPTAFPVGFTGSSSHVLYLGDITDTSATLKASPVGGGAAKNLVDAIGALPADTGTGVVYLTNAVDAGGFIVLDLGFVDAAQGGQPAPIADSVPDGEFAFRGKRLVYSRFADQGSGIYAASLP